jgi:hypothetical protein
MSDLVGEVGLRAGWLVCCRKNIQTQAYPFRSALVTVRRSEQSLVFPSTSKSGAFFGKILSPRPDLRMTQYW